MAVALEKTYVVNNLSRGIEGKMLVNLSEYDDTLPSGVIYSGAGITVNIDEADAAKFLPGQLFKVALTPLKSA